MARRSNQKSFYIDEDVAIEWKTFAERYPRLPSSMVVNEAMREYFARAKNGIDGNLKPLKEKVK